jgi:endogenous inhibitor of DNA gyrase (YacG/DUF329 family)
VGGRSRLRFAPWCARWGVLALRWQGTLPAGFRPAAQVWRKPPVAISHPGAHPCPRCQRRVAGLFTRRLPPGGSARVLTSHFTLAQGTLPAGFRPAAHVWREPPVAISHPGAHPCPRCQRRVAGLFTRRLPPGGSARVLTSHFTLAQGTLPAGFRPAAQVSAALRLMCLPPCG